MLKIDTREQCFQGDWQESTEIAMVRIAMSWVKSVEEMRIRTRPESGRIFIVEPIVLTEIIKCI